TGDHGPAAGEAERVLTAAALEVEESGAVDVAEQIDLFGEQGAATVAKETGLVTLVAVVDEDGGVPRHPIGFVYVAQARREHGTSRALARRQCADSRLEPCLDRRTSQSILRAGVRRRASAHRRGGSRPGDSLAGRAVE